MRCPLCETVNPPGADACEKCQAPLTALDTPLAQGPLEANLLTTPVSVLEPRPPVTVPATGTLGDAIRQMIDVRVGAVLVTGPGGELVGILTERDFLTKVAGVAGYESLPVSQFMTRGPETVEPTDALAVALGRMDAGGYRHLPVVRDGKPVGVISVRDVLRYLTTLGSDA
ncbi:signal transduction protein with cbs domains : CBS domain containing protein OS=uncultured Acidobacteria bacterium GN=HGMM_F54F02C36 PE=4 SV=1: CBS: CBS [Gemmataceae bacterium]|nr:signal transduction protein with cbs domains : CBS domain containing protein OS=uncultured Acidobacteria bacterium GN=HGMM_F54F02C36 PE=4 SV=1: CBS: CBS [Gemmataceae bacterium]VTT96434.1 signal transduction protein with cbs domains : CBS domain containing protein OS=uncultured Acidobacteria bacterium GN=HGMM_F54F02C36 PE=4 SV=1: CBS: CBS [Gemmataceae bacterium]